MTAIYGHRGARGERPENTIAAFAHAASLGLAGVECDVALTLDLVPVLHHDPDIAPLTFIRDLNLGKLRHLRPDIPTLAEALKAGPGMEWLLEIKTYPGAPEKSASPEAMVEAVLAVLENAGRSNETCILAFDWRVLAAVQQRAPKVRRICLTEPETEQSRSIWWDAADFPTATPVAVAQTGAFGWAPAHAKLTASQIEHAHRLGLKVFPWTVNLLADFNHLASKVDGIITDFPARMLQDCSTRQ